MRRLARFLFATSPRFGLTVAAAGLALLLANAIWRPEFPSPFPPFVAMVAGGISWAALTAYLRPVKLNGLGVALAVMAPLIMPYVDREMDLFVLIDMASIVVWALVCLAILAICLCHMLKAENGKARRFLSLLKEERIRAGRDPITGERK